MKKFGFLLVFGLLTTFSQAQSESDLDGKYSVLLAPGGFEDSVVIQGNTLIHVLNPGWGYGVEWQYLYSMVKVDDDWVQFEQIGFLRDRVEEPKYHKEGSLHLQKARLRKLESGDVEIHYEKYPDNPSIFTRVSN